MIRARGAIRRVRQAGAPGPALALFQGEGLVEGLSLFIIFRNTSCGLLGEATYLSRSASIFHLDAHRIMFLPTTSLNLNESSKEIPFSPWRYDHNQHEDVGGGKRYEQAPLPHADVVSYLK